MRASIRGTVFIGYVIAQGSMMLSVRRPGTSLVGPPSSLGVLTSQTLVVPSPFHPLRCRREACGWPRVCGGGGGRLTKLRRRLQLRWPRVALGAPPGLNRQARSCRRCRSGAQEPRRHSGLAARRQQLGGGRGGFNACRAGSPARRALEMCHYGSRTGDAPRTQKKMDLATRR